MANHNNKKNQAPSSTVQLKSEKTILVVEDDEDIGAMLVLSFQQETPYNVLLVSNGFDALQAARNIKPHLLILDYQLPKMNGIDLYDHLHSQPGLENTPGIMLSAHLPKKDLKQRELIGISKPFELTNLLSTVQQLLA